MKEDDEPTATQCRKNCGGLRKYSVFLWDEPGLSCWETRSGELATKISPNTHHVPAKCGPLPGAAGTDGKRGVLSMSSSDHRRQDSVTDTAGCALVDPALWDAHRHPKNRPLGETALSSMLRGFHGATNEGPTLVGQQGGDGQSRCTMAGKGL